MDPNDINYDDLTDEELNALESGEDVTEGGGDPAPEDEPTPQPDAEAAPEGDPAPDPAPETEPAPEVKPDLTPRAVPVPEYQAMRNRAQTAEQRATEAEQKAQHAAATAQYWKIHAEEGPDAAAEYWQGYQGEVQQQNSIREREAEVRREADQNLAVQRLLMSAEMAREVYGERFDAAYARLCEKFGADYVDARAAQQKNPGKWVVDFHDQELAPAPEAIEKRIADEVAKQVQAALSKNQAPAPRANPASSVAHVKTNAAPTPDDLEALDPHDLTDAQHAALDARDRERWRRR